MARLLAVELVTSFIVWRANSTNEVSLWTCSAGHVHNKEEKMINSNSKKHNTLGIFAFILIIGLASTSLPATFGKTITVSPMLIFAIVILSSLPHYLKPKNRQVDDADTTLFSKIFFINLAISTFLSTLMILIYKFAITLN